MIKRTIWLYCSFICLINLVGCAGDYDAAPVVERSVARYYIPATYHVRSGDTIYSIAWMFGLDYRQLIKSNRLTPPYIIHSGDTLQIKDIHAHKRVSDQQVLKRYPLRWIPPVSTSVLTGFSSHPLGNQGLNYAGRLAMPIVSAASGVVVYSGTGIRGYGNLIIIKHNQLFLSAYAYNLRNLVKEGDRVKKGQKIALMGRNNLGKVMLHFEIRQGGRPVNPMRFLH